MRILQVSTSDRSGGAEQVARQLHELLLGRGHNSWLAVGRQQTDLSSVLQIPNDEARGPVAQAFNLLADGLERLTRWSPRLQRTVGTLRFCGQPMRVLDRLRGKEDFDHPGTQRLLDLPPQPPQLVHCHNLHGGYFDLRRLPQISRGCPLALTLHDAWLLSGHCAHSFGCDRWQTGCGKCPDLSIYPAIRRDATAANWRLKADIFRHSRVHVATPCRWLMDRVERSLLAPGIITRRVIPNGIDLAIFQPGDRQAARTALGIPLDARVLVFAAAGIRNNPFKDFATLELALERLAFRTVQPILVLAIGETGQPQRWGNIERRLVGYVSCPKQMAQFYRSADLYVHAARAETAPLAIIEALACGTPVVASSVCGISELVRGLDAAGEGFSKAEATGMLVPAEDPEGLSATIEFLLTDDRLLASLGGNAARDAATRFDLKKMFEAYLDWYSEILEAERSRPASHALAEMDPRAAK